MLNACVWQPSRTCDFAGISSGNLNDLVQHGLRALRETLPTEQDLTIKVSAAGTRSHVCGGVTSFLRPFLQNVSIGIVGKDMEFTIYDDDEVAPFLEGLEERPQRKVTPASVGGRARSVRRGFKCGGALFLPRWHSLPMKPPPDSRLTSRWSTEAAMWMYFLLAIRKGGGAESPEGKLL